MYSELCLCERKKENVWFPLTNCHTWKAMLITVKHRSIPKPSCKGQNLCVFIISLFEGETVTNACMLRPAFPALVHKKFQFIIRTKCVFVAQKKINKHFVWEAANCDGTSSVYYSLFSVKSVNITISCIRYFRYTQPAFLFEIALNP